MNPRNQRDGSLSSGVGKSAMHSALNANNPSRLNQGDQHSNSLPHHRCRNVGRYRFVRRQRTATVDSVGSPWIMACCPGSLQPRRLGFDPSGRPVSFTGTVIRTWHRTRQM